MGPEAGSAGRGPQVLVVGLDGVPPEYLFDPKFLERMPNVRRLIERGVRAPLRTTDPPISIPAWPVMFTGVDPGTLGLYGFRHRVGNSYTETFVPDSRQIPVPTLWEIASRRGLRVGVVGMPMGYPPLAVNGVFVSDFLTPPDASIYTHPEELRSEIESRFGRFRFDVVFRAAERVHLFDAIVEMTRQHFEVAEYLIGREHWDLFGVQEIGTDRLNHAYTKYFDPRHPEFVPGNAFEKVADEYYPIVDRGIGRLLSHLDPDARVVLASDHGSMPMAGCFCINQWLEERGYLVLRRPPDGVVPIEKADVDWTRTSVWGAGGYYARLFFNRQGREPAGFLDTAAFAELRERLIRELGELRGPSGDSFPTTILDPNRIYATVREGAPDLMVYFDELRWRSAGSMGHPTNFLKENDTGPDDAVHSFHGVFVAFTPDSLSAKLLPPQRIVDVTPTILTLMGQPIPAHVQGRPMPLSGIPPAGPVAPAPGSVPP